MILVPGLCTTRKPSLRAIVYQYDRVILVHRSPVYCIPRDGYGSVDAYIPPTAFTGDGIIEYSPTYTSIHQQYSVSQKAGKGTQSGAKASGDVGLLLVQQSSSTKIRAIFGVDYREQHSRIRAAPATAITLLKERHILDQTRSQQLPALISGPSLQQRPCCLFTWRAHPSSDLSWSFIACSVAYSLQ